MASAALRPLAAQVGERIRARREAAGVSQVDLAARIQKGQAALSNWETGRRVPGLEDLMSVASALGIALADLLPPEQRERPTGVVLLRAMAGTIESDKLRAQVDSFIQQAEQMSSLPAVVTVPADRPARAAEELLARSGPFHLGGSVAQPAVNVDLLAQLCGARVVKQPFDDGLSGLLVTLEGGAAIGINNEHHEVRQRFTLAHELGHYLLAHYDRVHVDLPSAETGEAPFFDWRLEREANQFAADLLMPAPIVRELSATNTVGELARLFNVSQPAMGYRAVNLGIVSNPQ